MIVWMLIGVTITAHLLLFYTLHALIRAHHDYAARLSRLRQEGFVEVKPLGGNSASQEEEKSNLEKDLAIFQDEA